MKTELSDLRSGKTASDNYASDIEKKAKELKDAEDKLSLLLTGKTGSGSTSGETDADRLKRLEQERANLNQRINDNRIKSAFDARQAELDNQQRMLNLMQEGFEKEERQIELNHQRELLNIQKRAQELIEKQQQVEREHWEKEGSKDVFIAKTQTVADLPDSMQAELIATDSLVLEAREKATTALNERLIDKYKDFSAQRLEIEELFNKDLERLNQLQDSEDKQRAVNQLEKERKEAIQRINDEESSELVKTTDLFVRLFSDASRQSVNEIRKVIDETQALYDYLAGTNSEDITDNFSFTAEQLQAFKSDAEQLKAILDGLISKRDELGNKSPFQAFSKGLADGLEAINKGGADNIGKGVVSIGKAVDSFLPTLHKFGEDMGVIFGDKAGDNIGVITELLGGVGELGSGIGQIISGDIVGGITSAVSGIAKVVSLGSEANKRHKEALKVIDQQREEYQQRYNSLLREQNLLLKEASSIFGEKAVTQAINATRVFSSAIDDLHKGLNNLGSAKVVTGHKKKGWFGWGKGKDIYTSILDIPEYKDIIKDGVLDVNMTKAILDTRTMSDETRKYLESLIELHEFAEKAQDELRAYLQETFGSFGSGAIDSLVGSIKSGTNAWLEFGKVGAGVLENLGEQIAYELFFANSFDKLQDQLEEIFSSGKSPEQIANDSMKLVSDFYNGIGADLDSAQQWMEGWKQEAKKQGLDLWGNNDEFSQSSSRGGFTTASQDSINELSGRFTAIQMNTANIDVKMSDVISINLEANSILKEHSAQFQELRDVGLQSMYHLEDIVKHTKVLPETLPTMAKDISELKRKL